MYTAVGALSDTTLSALKKALPRCYEDNFEYCLDDANRKQESCLKYEPVHKAYDEDHDATFAIIEAMPECEWTTQHVVMAAGAGVVAGALLGFLLS
jgi:hypothetical protein